MQPLVLLVCVSQQSIYEGLIPRVVVLGGAEDSWKLEGYPREHYGTLLVHSL